MIHLFLLILLCFAVAIVSCQQQQSFNCSKHIRIDGGNGSAIVPGEYLVSLKTDYTVESEVEEQARNWFESFPDANATLDDVVATAIDAFSFRIDLSNQSNISVNECGYDVPEIVKSMLESDMVEYVEEEQTFQITDTSEPLSIQENPMWNLDRLDQSHLPLDNRYAYVYNGSTVSVYVIDTGIRYTHQDFGGRATCGLDVVGVDCEDENGHGTHVSGTVGGTVFGVAKGVQLIGIRVLNGEGLGTTSDIIEGINWVMQQRDRYPDQPMIINLSVGSPAPSRSLNRSIEHAVKRGIVFVAAAGNDMVDACTQSPGASRYALVVGATDENDQRSLGWKRGLKGSNWGPCVDLFAPGSSIRSTGPTSDTASYISDGTSMASPHVAGLAALFMETYAAQSRTAAEIHGLIIAAATRGLVKVRGEGSPNLLANSMDTFGNRTLPPGPTSSAVSSRRTPFSWWWTW